MKVTVIGGDRRMIFAKSEFERRGFEANALYPGQGGSDINGSDVIVLPVPVTRDGVNINCPLTEEKPPLSILFEFPENIRVFGGGELPLKNYTNYLALEEYAVKNAALTAEGAISYAIEHTGFSLLGSEILVIGCGRVGKALSRRLEGFAPRLTVSARSSKDLALLEISGTDHIRTGDIDRVTKRFDIVFNTVDIKFSSATAQVLAGSLFIDLSSRGGFEEDATVNLPGYIRLPGIPGKTAPQTAGRIIAETVINSLENTGEKYA